MTEKITEKDVKDAYHKYAEKYSLPEFEQFDNEYELVDHTCRLGFIPKKFIAMIRRIMIDKSYSLINYLHTFIYPNQNSVIYMREFQQFSDEERHSIQELVRQLMLICRKSQRLDFENTQKDDAEFIVHHYPQIEKIKKECRKVLEKSITEWEKPFQKDDAKPNF